MPTIHDNSAYHALVARIQQLTPAAERRWGTMSPAEMLEHLHLAIGCAVRDDMHLPDGSTFGSRTVGKYLFVHLLQKYPKGGKTGAMLLPHNTTDLAHGRALLLEDVSLLREQYIRAPQSAFFPHPLFGNLSGKEWGLLAYKHTDHHLRQFGV